MESAEPRSALASLLLLAPCPRRVFRSQAELVLLRVHLSVIWRTPDASNGSERRCSIGLRTPSTGTHGCLFSVEVGRRAPDSRHERPKPGTAPYRAFAPFAVRWAMEQCARRSCVVAADGAWIFRAKLSLSVTVPRSIYVTNGTRIRRRSMAISFPVSALYSAGSLCRHVLGGGPSLAGVRGLQGTSQDCDSRRG